MSTNITPETVVLPVSLRDWFAGRALAKLIADHTSKNYLADFEGSEASHDGLVSARAYEIADAMLRARTALDADGVE